MTTMHDAEFRPLSGGEMEILRKLLELNFAGRNELIHQLDGLLAKPIDTRGSLKLLVASADKAPVSRGVVAEARYADLDTKGDAGAHVNILLHVADGKLHMLEIYKDDGSQILKAPTPDEFQLFSPIASSP
jgi:hypothetical protein